MKKLMDFKEMEIRSNRGSERKKLLSQNKGQKQMIEVFVTAIENGGECPIPLRESFATTSATFGALESLRSGQATELISP